MKNYLLLQVTGMFVLNPEELVLEAVEEYRKNPDVIKKFFFL
jgi:hypothetical protein